MRVFIFKLNSLGDNIVFVPVIQALRRTFPSLTVTLLTSPVERELYGGPLGPQEEMVSTKAAFNKAYRAPWRVASWIWKIRRTRPDACLIPFDQSNVAHMVAKFSGAKVRIGGNLVRIRVKGSLTEDIPMPDDLRPVTWNWRMAGALARTLSPGVEWPDAPPAPELGHLLPAGPRPKGKRPRVVVHPGAGQFLNQWPVERFAAVASSLSRDHEVVWVSHGRTGGSPPEGTVAAVPRSLSDLAAWIVSADLFLGNNSGPMHLANALGRPGVVVTGPTTTGWDPYWHPERWTVLRHPNLACAPCEVTQVALERCVNLASPMACLDYWDRARVEAACRQRLQQETRAQ
jgi:ADP-heptose:LPS heptosyltransferase